MAGYSPGGSRCGERRPESRRALGANGTEVTALQEEWARYVGVNHCLAVNSGTAALHCAVVAVGVEPGDEVLELARLSW